MNPSEKYCGKTESVATRLAELDGFRVRITSRDGNHFLLTRDLRHDRMNFRVRNNFVYEAEVG